MFVHTRLVIINTFYCQKTFLIDGVLLVICITKFVGCTLEFRALTNLFLVLLDEIKIHDIRYFFILS